MVLSGSLPPGLAAGSYAELTAMAAAAGVPVLLDAHGDALRLGAAAGPAIVKPNLAELETFAGRPLSGADGADRPAVAAAAAGAQGGRAPEAVVVSLGAGRAATPTPATAAGRRGPPAVVAGNATGAGDAVAAGLAHGLALGRPWDERLRHAVALGTATRLAPVAGEFSPADYASAAGRDRGDARDGRRARGGRLMPLAGMSDIVGPARAAGRGVGAFNVIGIEHAEAIVAGAEAAAAPVVLQISENCVAYHGALEPIARACLSIAARPRCRSRCTWTTPPARTWCRPRPGWACGRSCTTRPALPYGQNVQATADMARWCQDRGIWVEAELGEIGGKNGVHSPARPHPSRTRRPRTSRPPGWTRWRSRSAARTPC